jgi:hypothetical protein
VVKGRVLVLGCVKQKERGVHPACDLYRSPLWKARRAYAESSGAPWFIASAKYGLLEPKQPIADYDLALGDLAPADRPAWGEEVAAALELQLGSLEGRTIEIHAGGAYRRVLEPRLQARGAVVVAPTASIRGIGTPIAWYAAESGSSRRQECTDEEVERALRDLDTEPVLVPAAEWPGALAHLDQPGLYARWVDNAGAAALSRGLGITINPGRIYAGLTGATKWPSGVTGKNTLRQRIGGNHIRGRIRGSTFRLTLAAILREELAFKKTGAKTRDPSSESELTAWIRRHLTVAVHSYPSADTLADLERRVLLVLDPPLNIDKTTATPARQRLTALRQRLSSADKELLAAWIGNGLQGYFSVEGDGARLVWRGPAGDSRTREVTEEVEPTDDAWRAFWRSLDELEVWAWHAHHYETPGVIERHPLGASSGKERST